MPERKPKADRPLTEAEIAKRRDATIKRMLSTPPKKQEDYKGKSIRPKDG